VTGPRGDARDDAERIAQNERWWDGVVDLHADSAFYDVPGFLAGKNMLLPLERARVGDVNGKRLLHLQCHFGLDTLSWARLGAEVVGVDISQAAIDKASALADAAGLADRATFVKHDVLELDDVEPLGAFDVVFVSYGALPWLPDLSPWARVVANHLVAGGVAHIIECHPVGFMLDEQQPAEGPLQIRYPYRSDDAFFDDEDGTYAEQRVSVPVRGNYAWFRGVADVVQPLLDAGLRLVHMSEHREGPAAIVKEMVRGDDRLYRLPAHRPGVPFVCALEVRKP
jgi:SAM-dependent methyltransferase